MESTQLRNAYSEVYTILDKLDLISNLPNEVVSKLLDERNSEHYFDFDRSKDLYEQITNVDTMSIISYLYVTYICNDKEEKEELISKYKENELKYQADLREKYDIDKVFANRRHDDIQKEEIEETEKTEKIGTNPMIIPKKNVFQRIIERIKNFFKK